MVEQVPGLLKKYITSTEQGIIINIMVIPNSKTKEIEGVDEWRGCLKVRVKAQAQKGKANRDLIELLASSLAIPTSDITIKSGETSRVKEIEIRKLTELEFLAKLGKIT